MRLLRVCWSSGLFRRASAIAWSIVSVVVTVVSVAALCADARALTTTRPMRISVRFIMGEVSFLTMYGQLYNRVSGPDTVSFLKKGLTPSLAEDPAAQRYSVGAGARNMRSLILA